MATPSIAASVFKLAIAGEQAGLKLEQMIELLNAGVTLEMLLGLIEWKLTHEQLWTNELGHVSSSRWIM